MGLGLQMSSLSLLLFIVSDGTKWWDSGEGKGFEVDEREEGKEE